MNDRTELRREWIEALRETEEKREELAALEAKSDRLKAKWLAAERVYMGRAQVPLFRPLELLRGAS